MSNSIVAHFEPPVQDRRKLAKHLAVDLVSLRYCFTCPLPDCVDKDHSACPIFQAKRVKDRQSPSGAAPLQPARSAPLGRPAC
ncbi:MAG: hypothetical protein HC875_35320 [Anaerolineales bacterium]|nr:hypothetical protein [Anaerolineales bacterium]